MAVLSRLAHERKLNPLPLFEWAEQNQQLVFDPLLITSKLTKQLRLSQSVLNAWADANGYKGREASR